MSDYKEQNYWPGFVDALSNVVLTLVFVLVVFVFALVFSSDKLRKRAAYLATAVQQETVEKKVAEAEKQKLIDENCDIRAQLQAALARLQELETANLRLQRSLSSTESEKKAVETEVKALERRLSENNLLKERNEIQVRAENIAALAGTAELEGGEGAIVLVFPRNVFKLDDKAKAALDAVLSGKKASLRGALSSVLSIMGAETYSEGRRLAYFRGLAVRNYLIEQGLGDGRTIHVMIEEGKEVNDGRVEIRFRRP
ncbi:hypothetical protein [Oleispirillum naphthae]|uniref:hypothetical protein n=1 Tax=Oleispirillum naphthae TaxID=2838853 RepID=UPI0030824BD2